MTLGHIAFLGSGETSLAGGRIFESLARGISDPLHVAIMETTAGFELNSAQVAGRVAEFLKTRLQNYKPIIDVIPARKLGTEFSPDNPEILKPLLHANMIFMGPGSPSYAVRQLKDTLAWDIIRARHRLGATLIFASAATISVGAWALPVYEIYKVGEDVHVKEGLNMFADYGMNLSFVPHWNNAEGGIDLDTSRCFFGKERFDQWRKLLPAESIIVGLDEHTGIIMDCKKGMCEVSGVSSVSVGKPDSMKMYPAGASFSSTELGQFVFPDPIEKNIRPDIWEMVINASKVEDEQPPAEALNLLEQRQAARARKDFAESDRLRDEIVVLGWTVQDSKDGQKLVKR
ncbi:MAG: cysteinyl-tRNA synthetase [Anaerolineales bacterium]|nr:cysteinyl-tRNA synthetase [Anaerolineales bacterium]